MSRSRSQMTDRAAEADKDGTQDRRHGEPVHQAFARGQ